MLKASEWTKNGKITMLTLYMCNTAVKYKSLADPGDAYHHPPPHQRAEILSFSHTFSTKSAPPPLRLPTPNGKSWIRPCQSLLDSTRLQSRIILAEKRLKSGIGLMMQVHKFPKLPPQIRQDTVYQLCTHSSSCFALYISTCLCYVVIPGYVTGYRFSSMILHVDVKTACTQTVKFNRTFSRTFLERPTTIQ